MIKLALLFLLIFVSCTGKHKMEDIYFKEATEITGEKLPEEYLTSFSFCSYYTPYGFLGSMMLPNNSWIHLADLHSGKILSSVCPKGRGPGELLALTASTTDFYNNTLYALDPVVEKVQKVSLENNMLVLKESLSLISAEPRFIPNIQVVSDSLFVLFTSSVGYRYAIELVNTQSEVISRVDYCILDDDNIDHSKVGGFSVDMKMSPCRRYLYILNKFNSVKKYSIADNKIELMDNYFITEPQYTVEQGKLNIKDSQLFLHGSLAVGDEYIYISVTPEYAEEYMMRKEEAQKSGVMMSNEPDANSYILVFDSNMKFVNSYKLDTQIGWMTLTPDNSIIYAADYTNHCLTKYTLQK